MNGRIKNILISVVIAGVCIFAGYVMGNLSAPAIKPADAFDVPKIAVHIKGAVANPGFYELEAASRVNDAIAAAGGLLEGANTDAINLAEFVEDGAEIVIPYKTETVSSAENHTSAVKININTASVQQLSTLDGIGLSIAEKIVEYRNERGDFAVKEEIMNVSGIGETLFKNIKDKICVN